MGLQSQQREQLVHARRNRQLLGRDPVDAALDEQFAEPFLDAGPVALHLLLGAYLLTPQAAADVDRLGRRSSAASDSDRLCAGSVEMIRVSAGRRRRSAGGAGRDRRLADATLPV